MFGKKKQNDTGSERQEYPWDRTPSIYQHFTANLLPDGCGLTQVGQTLPDDERIASKSTVRWASGAMDGVLTHHMGVGSDEEKVEVLLKSVRAYCATPTAHNKLRVYEHIVENETVALIDPFIEAITQQRNIDHDRFYDLVRSFATEGSDREAVKFGIAILGIYRNPDDLEIFRTLGQHDEFTLFAAVAISNSEESAEYELWNLAKCVDGWGRIHIVERLADTEEPPIREWMLREGYKNCVMYEYLAFTCATTGGLLEALERNEVDEELLTAAGEIIQALTAGGPAKSMADYEDGVEAVRLYLTHVRQQGTALSQFLAVTAIKRLVSDVDEDSDQLKAQGWTLEVCVAFEKLCNDIIAQQHWPKLVAAALASQDEQEFWQGNLAAQELGIETWDVHWDRIRQKPLDSGRWYNLMQVCTEDRIAEVVAFAEHNLPLEEIASGPGTELGLGAGWEPHGCLDYILQRISNFPGMGSSLIEAGLRSPVTRNRHGALRVLSKWGEENWTGSARKILAEAVGIEPDENVRDNIRKVLDGEKLES